MTKFKRILCIVLAMLAILAFVACDDDDETSSSESSSQSESVTDTESESVTDTETESETQTESGVREGENMNTELGSGYSPAYPPDYSKK